MPNWNSNRLQVTGLTEEETNAMADAITKNELLQTYLPRPADEELPYSTNNLTDEEKAAYRERFGASSGYSWCNRYWGTKWDVSDASIDTYECNRCGFSSSFLTAWAPPIEGLVAISRQFPSATFLLRFEEPGADFMGAVAIRDGLQVEKSGHTPSSLFEEWAQQNLPDKFAAYQKAVEDEDDDTEWDLQDEMQEAFNDEDVVTGYLELLEEAALDELNSGEGVEREEPVDIDALMERVLSNIKPTVSMA